MVRKQRIIAIFHSFEGLTDSHIASLHRVIFSISLYNSLVLYFFYGHKEEGMKRKGSYKERTLSRT